MKVQTRLQTAPLCDSEKSSNALISLVSPARIELATR